MTLIDYIVEPVVHGGLPAAKKTGESPLYWLAPAAASTILISIAVSQILLGISLLALFVSYGHLHNVYLQYAPERGIPGLLCLLWIIGKMAWDFRAALHEHPPDNSRFICIGSLAVISSVLAAGFFEYNLGDSEVLTLFLTMTTYGYVVLRRTSPLLS